MGDARFVWERPAGRRSLTAEAQARVEALAIRRGYEMSAPMAVHQAAREKVVATRRREQPRID
jgi:hypothetical protein